jgi:predicted metal-dependent HD superfamily phosphohydrolase
MNSWTTLAKKYTNDNALASRLYDELMKKYGRLTRHYHNWLHIESLLRLSDVYANQLQQKDIVDLSIYYHDFIYTVLRKDNEKRSAAAAEKRLQLLKVPQEKIDQVKIFIEATQTHRIPRGYALTDDLAYFLDFDMAILGADWEIYKRYTEQVRKEYIIYPFLLYKAGRKKFLQGCLAAKFIFHTFQFREKFEPIARQNITKELELYQ